MISRPRVPYGARAGIAEIDDIFLRHQGVQTAHGGQTAQAGVKYADGSRLSIVLLQCQRDQAVERLGIADALVIKQLGVHADRGKARNRIQLVENDLAAVVGDKEVYAGQAAAAECGINADSVLTDGLQSAPR